MWGDWLRLWLKGVTSAAEGCGPLSQCVLKQHECVSLTLWGGHAVPPPPRCPAFLLAWAPDNLCPISSVLNPSHS